MTEINMRKMTLVGTGIAEMPQDGKRFRFYVERYRHDDGSEWGQIVHMEEIPDVGPYLWVPSYGMDASEAQYLFEEHQYERENPHPMDKEWWDQHRHEQREKMARYDELRDMRADIVKKNHRTLGGSR